jgi:hypothetical protein
LGSGRKSLFLIAIFGECFNINKVAD